MLFKKYKCALLSHVYATDSSTVPTTLHSLVMNKFWFSFFRGENVEDAFLDTAKKIYQNIQDGRYVWGYCYTCYSISLCYSVDYYMDRRVLPGIETLIGAYGTCILCSLVFELHRENIDSPKQNSHCMAAV